MDDYTALSFKGNKNKHLSVRRADEKCIIPKNSLQWWTFTFLNRLTYNQPTGKKKWTFDTTKVTVILQEYLSMSQSGCQMSLTQEKYNSG